MGVVMVLEPNFKKVVSSVRRKIGTTQSVIELKLPTNDNEINAIYSVGANANISSVEIVGSIVNFTGLVDFQAVYKSSMVSSLDYTAEFKDKFDAGEEISGELIATASVVQVNSSLVGNDIRVVAIVEVSLDLIENKELSVLVSVDNADAYKSYKDITYSTYVGKAYEKFDVTGTLEIKDATAVHMVSSCARLSDVVAKDDYILVRGVMGLDICYSVGDDLSSLRSTYRELDFDWEVAYSGASSDSSIESMVSTISNEIKVSSIVTESGMEVDIDVPTMFNGFVFENNKLTIVEDVYLESNYLSITAEVMPTIADIKSLSFKDNISGSAEINDAAAFIDEVLSVSVNNIVLARNYVDDGRLVVEGVVFATAVYYTKETATASAVQIEMPFAVEQKASCEYSSVVTLCLGGIAARSRRGKEIEVSGELYCYVDCYGLEDSVVISGITLGEEKPEDDCSLYIYIVKPEQTVWDIAKEMNVSVELIMEQNPNITDGLKTGDRLVIYKPKMIDFN